MVFVYAFEIYERSKLYVDFTNPLCNSACRAYKNGDVYKFRVANLSRRQGLKGSGWFPVLSTNAELQNLRRTRR